LTEPHTFETPHPGIAPDAPNGPSPAGRQLGLEAEALGARLPPLMVAALNVAETVSPGAHGRRRVGQGESFWQFRPWQDGDTTGRVDWRQSAKGDRLYIRETEWAAAQSVFLWRDAGPGMEYRSDRSVPTKRQRAELLLLALAALLLRGGERVAVLGGGRQPAAGRGVLPALQAALDQNAPLAAADPPVPRHATLVLFGDFLGPVDVIAAALTHAAARGAAVDLVQVLDPAEIALPFQGRVRFREMVDAPGPGSDVLTPRVETIRDAYRAALERQQAELGALARSHGWRFLVHSTGEPPEIPLRFLHRALTDRLADRAEWAP
jgi:uncharacterized protein (DUF58 family)